MDIQTMTLGEIVAQSPSVKQIFEDKGIDYCCRGDRQLKDVLVNIHGDQHAFIESIIQSFQTSTDDLDWMHVDYEVLIKHIIDTHHGYLNQTLDPLSQRIHKIFKVHGDNHHELRTVYELFSTLKLSLETHMIDEESQEFPLVIEYEKTNDITLLKQAQSLMNGLIEEHEAVGTILHKIRTLTNDYNIPEDACPTFKETYKSLEILEKDMFTHIHLENNVLFKRLQNE